MSDRKSVEVLHEVVNSELDTLRDGLVIMQERVESLRDELHQQLDLCLPSESDKRKGPLPWPRAQVCNPLTGAPVVDHKAGLES